MLTIEDYIYENILMEEMKLNRLSNQLGKILLTIYNSLSKLEDAEKYDNIINVLKEMRVEMLVLEKKFYAKQITSKKLKANFASYIKALKKIKKELSAIDDKKIKRALEKMDKLADKFEELKIVL